MEPHDPTPTDQVEPWPYDLRHSRWRRGPVQWVVVVVVASLGLAGLAGAVQKGSWLSAVVTVMFVGPLVCFALSLTERDKQPTGSFRLVSPGRSGADPAPVDDWLHVAGLRPPRRVIIVAMGWATVGLACLMIAAAAQLIGLVPPWNPDTTRPQFAIATALCVVFGGVTGWVTWALVARRRASTTDGQNTTGVGLGEHAVRVDVPGRRVNLRWDDIIEIGASQQRRPRTRFPGERPELPMIRIRSSDRLPATHQVQFIPISTNQVPAAALWTALRWYHAHPGARWELGHAEGSARLEQWRREALLR